MKFETLSELVQKQFEKMSKQQLYIVDLEPNDVWDMYINSFPEGTNNIYRERK